MAVVLRSKVISERSTGAANSLSYNNNNNARAALENERVYDFDL
jgi:hypothetical protein